MNKKVLSILMLCPSVLMAADTIISTDPLLLMVGIGKSEELSDNISVEGSVHFSLLCSKLQANAVLYLPVGGSVHPRIYMGGGVADFYDKGIFKSRLVLYHAAGIGVKIDMRSGSAFTVDYNFPTLVSVSYHLRSASE